MDAAMRLVYDVTRVGRREHPRFPIRLSVRYPSARSLLGDYTRSVSKGGVAIESERRPDIGTQFVFEMTSPEVAQMVEIRGRVVWTRASAQPGKYVLGIQYTFADSERRAQLEHVIETILSEHRYERQRRHPRMPVTIEVQGLGRIWSMRDLSQGGASLQSSTNDPIGIVAGQRLRLDVRVDAFDAVLEAETIWVAQPFPVHGEQMAAGRLGFRFVGLTAELRALVDRIMRAQVLPTRVGLVARRLPKRGLE